jgi:hypothetical protein
MGKQGVESRLRWAFQYSTPVVDVSLVPRPVVHMWQRSTPAAADTRLSTQTTHKCLHC